MSRCIPHALKGNLTKQEQSREVPDFTKVIVSAWRGWQFPRGCESCEKRDEVVLVIANRTTREDRGPGLFSSRYYVNLNISGIARLR